MFGVPGYAEEELDTSLMPSRQDVVFEKPRETQGADHRRVMG